jgi:hypothetical protein
MKRAVALGYLDFGALAARREALGARAFAEPADGAGVSTSDLFPSRRRNRALPLRGAVGLSSGCLK